MGLTLSAYIQESTQEWVDAHPGSSRAQSGAQTRSSPSVSPCLPQFTQNTRLKLAVIYSEIQDSELTKHSASNFCLPSFKPPQPSRCRQLQTSALPALTVFQTASEGKTLLTMYPTLESTSLQEHATSARSQCLDVA